MALDEEAAAIDAPVADAPAAAGTIVQDAPAPAAGAEAGKAVANGKAGTIATGAEVADEPEVKDAPKSYWPADWRQKAAEHYAAGDKKAFDRELRRLERVADPAGLYGMYRELDNRLNGGGLIKVPGKDAKPEEIAAYHKALGVPEKPEDYFKQVKLENGAVIGEADKPMVDAFAAALHKAGAPPAAMNAALSWYYKQQEDNAAALDQADDTYRRESEKALKEEWGPAFKRQTNAIATLFAAAPGGTDINNTKGLMARIMGGRTADGKIIGNDPDMIRFLVSMASEVNPAVTVVEEGSQGGMTIDAEISSIEKDMRENRPAYFKDEKKQSRYRDLLNAREKIQARQRA